MTYEVIADPYCYAGTSVLKNIPGIRDSAALEAFEAVSTIQRSDEPLPEGRFSATHYKAIHFHLFQDVYIWAGKFRTLRMGKGQNMFCYPENIACEMKQLFADLKVKRYLREMSSDEFASAAAGFLAMLNAVHPFREGNGRTQTAFLMLLADRAGHPLELERLVPGRFLTAMVASFGGNEEPLAAELRKLI